MKTNKKWLSLFVALCFVFLLSACELPTLSLHPEEPKGNVEVKGTQEGDEEGNPSQEEQEKPQEPEETAQANTPEDPQEEGESEEETPTEPPEEPEENTADGVDVSDIKPTDKLLAITFDDGPSDETTPVVLDALKDVGGHGTFFVVGSRVESNAEALKRASDEGNEIGIHTWNHPDLTTLSEEDMHKEIDDTADAIEAVTGIRPTLVRPPYGAADENVMKTLDNPLIIWSVDSEDWRSRNADAVYNEIMKYAYDRSIILVHDIYDTSVEGASRAIHDLSEQGYRFVTVSELMKANGIDLTGHAKYFDGKKRGDN